jgi:hypothetical protein
MPDFEEDDGEGASNRTHDPELARHDFAREGAFDRIIYDLELRQDIKLAWQELDFKARLEAVLKEIRRHQIAEPEPRQKPGPKPTQFERVKAAMGETVRAHGVEHLRAMKYELMKALYGASDHTCSRARKAVLGDNSD